MNNYILSFLILTFITQTAVTGQVLEPATWTTELSNNQTTVGGDVDLVFKVNIEEGWYMYSSDFDPDLGPQVTEFNFSSNDTYKLIGHIEAIEAKEKYDSLWEGRYTYFIEKAEFRQRITVLSPDFKIAGTFRYQVCSMKDGRCIPFEEEFNFSDQLKRNGNTTSATSAKPVSQKPSDTLPNAINASTKKEDPVSLWVFMTLAFLGGVAALFTPCIFPMVPMTVTFFTSRTANRKKSVVKAAIFGISIILIYIVAGTFVAVVNGPGFANWLSTHWLPNVFFFLVFMAFSLSFLGMFELTLPSGLVNKVDKQSDRGGYYGVFFMAFTLVLVSFSCTGPIVGSILVEAAGGMVLKPVLGMLAFSMAFAIPFTLFAVFPEWLNSLPKSGSWLNSVKVVLGFLELALGLKFLSVADQVYRWGILDRDVYLVLWIVIFFFLGLYLIGKIRIVEENSARSIGILRILLAMLVFGFTLYLVPGLFGAPLKALSGYLPPLSGHDFNLAKMVEGDARSGREVGDHILCDEPKHRDILHLPQGIKGYFDYEQALACAREQGKPLLIDFTGHGCVNCREMEASVWSDREVLSRLKRHFIVAALYVDDKTELPETSWYKSKYDGRVKKSIGTQNADLQIRRFNNNAQPYYVILDPYSQETLVAPTGYNLDVGQFSDFLEEGLINFKKLNSSID